MFNDKTKNQSPLWVFIIFLIYSFPLLSKTNPSLKRIGNEVIYLIMVDRFHNGNPSNDFPISTETSEMDKMLMYRMMDPTQGQDYTRHFGGDLRGVIDKLDYLHELGVTMLWLTPIIENTNAKLEGGGFAKTSYHGYWGKNWFKIDPHLADSGVTDPDLMKELIQKAHSKGIKIILDLVLNHSSPINGKESQEYLDQTSRLTIFDFNFRDSLYEAFHPKKRNLPNLNKLIQQLNKNSKYRSEFATFLDNHDYPRFLSDSGDEISFLAALSVLFTMPGAPTLFYGNEFQVFDTKERTGFMGQIGGDPFNRPKMIFDSESKSQFTEKLKQLIQLRSKYTYLQDGSINARLKINSPYYTSEIDYELTIQNKSSKNNSYQFILTRIHFDSKLNIKKISIEDSSKTILLEYKN